MPQKRLECVYHSAKCDIIAMHETHTNIAFAVMYHLLLTKWFNDILLSMFRWLFFSFAYSFVVQLRSVHQGNRQRASFCCAFHGIWPNYNTIRWFQSLMLSHLLLTPIEIYEYVSWPNANEKKSRQYISVHNWKREKNEGSQQKSRDDSKSSYSTNVWIRSQCNIMEAIVWKGSQPIADRKPLSRLSLSVKHTNTLTHTLTSTAQS